MAGDGVDGLAGGPDRRLELLLHDRLDTRVDRGDEGVPGPTLDLPGVAEHASHAVHGNPFVAGFATEVLVVLLLDSGAPHHRGPVHGGVALVLRLVELALGDRAEVAEQVRGVDAVRRRVGTHTDRLGQHGGVVLALLQDGHRGLLRDVLGDRDRLVGRAVPACAGHRPGLPAQQRARRDVVVRRADGVRDSPEEGLLSSRIHLPQQRAVDRHHPGGAVRDERAAHVVDDQAPGRLHDDLAHRLLRSLRLVGLATEHLQVPQPREQRDEQGEHDGLHHDQAQGAALPRRRPDPVVVEAHQ
jgi:hypothetical protein